ncbi:protein SODIUM POTASSIUM ROOT DEFECTIVE 1 isoform X5 [Triticum aestivum]|uniref:protein SODIUM POTASSIUM ROOT DEFECTIVE 1 isoform X5 n=1 Tax=Triticum aestivum TaxID=4565 RepID=UPI001D00C50B|nr:protein SODIUM POTASSIUM ROOT DEFECTIVE 1-like isoform X5 [Triticum aestivum]
MPDRPYSLDERMLQLLGEGTRTPLLPPATLPSAPSLWNTSTPSSEPPAVYLIMQVVVLKVSLHYKVCAGKVKKHLTKMEGEHQHLLKFGDKIMHLESWEDQLLTNNMSLEDMLQQCSNLN